MKTYFHHLCSISTLEQTKILDNKVICFSAPDNERLLQINHKNVYWKGSKKQWEKLFSHFIYAFTETYLYSNSMKNQVDIGNANIPIHNFNFEKKPLLIDTKLLLPKISERTYSDLLLEEFCIKIANLTMSYSELLYILKIIRLMMSFNIYETQLSHNIEGNAHKSVTDIQREKLFKYNLYASKENQNEEPEDNHHKSSSLLYLQKYFCGDYLDRLIHQFFPHFYILTHTREFPASSLWHKRAEHHTGVCLIYENQNFMKDIPDYANILRVTTPIKPFENKINFFDFAIKNSLYWIDENSTQADNSEKKFEYYHDFFMNYLVDTDINESEEHIILGYPNTLRSTKHAFEPDNKNLAGLVFGGECDIFAKNRIIDYVKSKVKDGSIRDDFEFHQAKYDHSNDEVVSYFVAYAKDF